MKRGSLCPSMVGPCAICRRFTSSRYPEPLPGEDLVGVQAVGCANSLSRGGELRGYVNKVIIGFDVVDTQARFRPRTGGALASSGHAGQ